MRRAAWSLLLVVGAVLAAPTVVDTSSAFQQLLDKAESIRSADPTQFSKLIDQLQANSASANEQQRQQLRYLSAYRRAFRGDAAAAVDELKSLFQEASDPELKFRVGAFLVNNYAVTRDFAAGLAYLDRTLALLKDVRSHELRHQGLYVAALIYNQVGQYDLGRDYAEQVLNDDPSPRSRCFAAQVRVEALSRLDMDGLSEASARSAIDWCEEQREPVVAGFARLALARKWVAQDHAEQARQLLEAALTAVSQTRYPTLLAEYFALLAELANASADSAQARDWSHRALEADPLRTNISAHARAYRVLSATAEQSAQLDLALEYLRKGAEAESVNLGELQARQMAFHLARMETMRKNQSIEILSKQNEVLRLQQQVAQQTVRNNQLLLALLAVLLASIGLWAWRTQRTQISLRRLAEQDVLTGVLNRRHFTHLAEGRLASAAGNGTAVCMVMFDLDHFKRINDSYGHPTGDWVLKQAAELCTHSCRRNDLIGRMGGEEFAILLIGCDIDAAMLLADHCREAIAAIDSSPTGHQFKVSASFGVASAQDAGYEFKTLFRQADLALYQSKHGGRNRVEFWSGDASTSDATTA